MNSNNRGRGRPKGPSKVVFKRRVLPSLVERLDGVILGEAGSVAVSQTPPVAVPDRDQISALLNDVDRLEKELVYWKARFEKAVTATEHQMAAYWKDRALKAESKLGGKSEFDQT